MASTEDTIPDATPSDEFKEPLSKTSAAGTDEAELKSRYPAIRGRSALLQRHLHKERKYFDSGDYQMAKQRGSITGGSLPVKHAPESRLPTTEPSQFSSQTDTDR